MDSTTAVPTAPPRRNTDSSADSLSEHEDVSSLASGWSEDDQSESQGDGQPREDSTTPTPVVPVLTSLLAVSTPAQDVETLRRTIAWVVNGYRRDNQSRASVAVASITNNYQLALKPMPPPCGTAFMKHLWVGCYVLVS